jgi:hypothetical protein
MDKKQWNAVDETITCDALAFYGWHPLPASDPVVVELSVLLDAKPVSVSWKMKNMASVRKDYVGTPTHASGLSRAIVAAFEADPETMHRIGQLLRTIKVARF